MPNEIVVALIGAGVTVLGMLVELSRRQNNRDHAANSAKLDAIDNKIEKLDSRLGNHLEWHAHSN